MGDHVNDPIAPGLLGQVSLLVRDTARAEGFYGGVLGLPHLFTFGALAFFDCGGVRLFLRAVPDEEWRPSSILYFRVDDIEPAFRALVERGATRIQGPAVIHRDETSGTEEWMAFFADPDGNVLALMSRVPFASG
jgi:methylmalonyl-CoA/ethylmalonyl-CoA epimerase